MLLEELQGTLGRSMKERLKAGVEQTSKKILENLTHLHTGNLRNLMNGSTEGNHSNYQF